MQGNDWLIREIIIKAIESDASDIHFQAGKPVFMRIHGAMTAVDVKPTRADLEDIVSLIMKTEGAVASLYDKDEKDMSYSISTREGLIRFRVNVSLTKDGVYVAMRRLKSVNPNPISLGVPRKLIDTVLSVPYGIVFIAGQTGCGKSTTLASLVSYFAEREPVNIVTIEDPIEYELLSGKSNLIQREVHRHTQSFAQALRAAMRQDPDIILVGEVRDPDTAIAAIQAARSGHIVFSTVHTSQASQINKRIASMFPPDRQSWINTELVEVLVAGVVQALVPDNSGKRVLATEMMVCTDAKVKEVMLKSEDSEGVRAAMKSGEIGWTLNQNLMELYDKNMITQESVLGYSNDLNELSALNFTVAGAA